MKKPTNTQPVRSPRPKQAKRITKAPKAEGAESKKTGAKAQSAAGTRRRSTKAAKPLESSSTGASVGADPCTNKKVSKATPKSSKKTHP